MSRTFEEATRLVHGIRKQRRSSAIAVTTETQHLLECIQVRQILVLGWLTSGINGLYRSALRPHAEEISYAHLALE